MKKLAVILLLVLALFLMMVPALAFEVTNPGQGNNANAGECMNIMDPGDTPTQAGIAPWSGHFNADDDAPLSHGAC